MEFSPGRFLIITCQVCRDILQLFHIILNGHLHNVVNLMIYVRSWGSMHWLSGFKLG